MKPIRVQRKAKVKAPPNTIYSGVWPNPYQIREENGKWIVFDERRGDYIRPQIKKPQFFEDELSARKFAVDCFEKEFFCFKHGDSLSDYFYVIAALEEVLELKGKNISCWCSLDKPCHADILLGYANSEDVLSMFADKALEIFENQ